MVGNMLEAAIDGQRVEKRLRVLIVDDHRIVADSISSYLRDVRGFDVRSAMDLDSGLAALRGDGPFDVVLMDVVMPGVSGLAAVDSAISAADGAPVIVFSGNATEDMVRKALDQGAQGYIPKSFPLRSLSTAIELVANGERFVPVDFAQRAANVERQAEHLLTRREIDVLRGIAEGKTNKVLAYELNSSEASVKMNVRSICQKLSAQNRAHAVVKGKEMMLI